MDSSAQASGLWNQIPGSSPRTQTSGGSPAPGLGRFTGDSVSAPQNPLAESRLKRSVTRRRRPARSRGTREGDALLPRPRLPAEDGSVPRAPSGSLRERVLGFPWRKLLLSPPSPRPAPPGTAVPVRPLPLSEVTRDRRLGVLPWALGHRLPGLKREPGRIGDSEPGRGRSELQRRQRRRRRKKGRGEGSCPGGQQVSGSRDGFSVLKIPGAREDLGARAGWE